MEVKIEGAVLGSNWYLSPKPKCHPEQDNYPQHVRDVELLHARVLLHHLECVANLVKTS